MLILKEQLEQSSILAPIGGAKANQVYQHMSSSRFLNPNTSPKSLRHQSGNNSQVMAEMQLRDRQDMYSKGGDIERMLMVMAGHGGPPKQQPNRV